MSESLDVVVPNWPAPTSVRACCTTRRGGVSAPPFATLNLAAHVGDVADAVNENRARIRLLLGLPQEPRWLRQVHGARVVNAARSSPATEADAGIAVAPRVVCAVLVADCLPLLLCDRCGKVVAAVHAGWRGLAANLIQATVRAMATPARDILAWMGPAICVDAFEVGPEVRQRFLQQDRRCGSAFQAGPTRNRWRADIYALAVQALRSVGVTEVYGGGWCTYSDSDRFYSYRRDGTTGRMAAMIWLDAVAPAESVGAPPAHSAVP
jgi:YfiH family protein